MSQPQRDRPVSKGIWFSEDEWQEVMQLMASVGHTNFSEWARETILNGKVVVNSRPMDARRVRAALYPIGNNINQVARRVNIDDILYLEDLQEIRALMARAVAILERYAATLEPLGQR